jgi:hypothetical protein
MQLHFRAWGGDHKEHRQKVVNKIVDPVARAEEHDCELYASDLKTRLWQLPRDGSGARHFEYDAKQEGRYRILVRAWDHGNNAAVTIHQMVKFGPMPWSFQLRLLGEVVTQGLLVHEVAERVHQRMLDWFPMYDPAAIPCLDYPDVAGKQGNRQTFRSSRKSCGSTSPDSVRSRSASDSNRALSRSR